MTNRIRTYSAESKAEEVKKIASTTVMFQPLPSNRLSSYLGKIFSIAFKS